MIAAHERIEQRDIFQAVRRLVQELHPDKAILEDIHGAPFLFKSQDAQVWVRVFYRSMRDFSVEELKQEIQKLWVLMPRTAVLYLFFPILDRAQILRMNGISDRLSFFEYGQLQGLDRDRVDLGICKWVPSMSFPVMNSEQAKEGERPKTCAGSILQKVRLSSQEIVSLTEMFLVFNRG